MQFSPEADGKTKHLKVYSLNYEKKLISNFVFLQPDAQVSNEKQKRSTWYAM